jgi:type II secretory pathway pseudopilin PulG
MTVGASGMYGAGQRGYAMLSLLATMTIMALALGAAMPTVQHELQRHKEEDFFYNGAQAATALGMFYLAANRYPTKMEELTQPVTIPVGHPNNPYQRPILYHLRPAALVDPLTGRQWEPVREGDPLVAKFINGHDAHVAANLNNPSFRYIPFAAWPQPFVMKLRRSGVVLPGDKAGDKDGAGEARSAFSLNPESREIVGLVSRSNKQLIRGYYGVNDYGQALILAAWCDFKSPAPEGPSGPPGPQPPVYGCRVLRMPGADKSGGPALNVQVVASAPGRLPAPAVSQ